MSPQPFRDYYRTGLGRLVLGDSVDVLSGLNPGSVDLVVTSPPFPLLRKKQYGNVEVGEYLEWFKPFALAIRGALRRSGSLVLDLGGTWAKGEPSRSLYPFRLLLMLCDGFGFHLAQDFYWWNPSALPAPVEWVNIRRIRVKDAVHTLWWLSPTPWPRASNQRVLQPYSARMEKLLEGGCEEAVRPSGHTVGRAFEAANGGAIPPNLLAVPNTDSNGAYLRYCRREGIPAHPARFPAVVPEYFIRMLTDPGDLVVDPFAGSAVTGEVAERLGRPWLCVEKREDYCRGAVGRFVEGAAENPGAPVEDYRAPRPGILWAADPEGRAGTLRRDGGSGGR